VGGKHAVELVVEEFVEALAADSGLAEDVGDGGRVVAIDDRDGDDRGQQPFPLGALDQLARKSVPPPRQPPLPQILGVIAHRDVASQISASRARRDCFNASSWPPYGLTVK